MSPLLLALSASLAWGVADFVGPLRARTLGALPVLLWAQVGGLVAIGIAVAVRGDGPHGWAVAYATLAGEEPPTSAPRDFRFSCTQAAASPRLRRLSLPRML